ncbi:MAG: LPS assembly protein LptD, partial [Beijerinckiaceae bacterium]
TGLPNNDAQSLSFDDTTLFETSKFSGYDRVEGGVRANVGVQYTFQGVGGSYANLLFGQSYQLAGRNSYLLPDLANVGLDSGLDKDRSDFVGRAIFAPNSTFSVMSRARFDERTFALQRIEAGPTFNFNFISGSILYARYDAQPELGYAFRREGILLSGNIRLNTNWSVSTTAIFDNDRYIAAREAITQGVQNVTGASSRAALSTMAVGLQYKDECTIFSVQYVSSGYRDIYSGVSGPSRAIYVKLELRSLGEVGFSQGINSASGRDGVATQ